MKSRLPVLACALALALGLPLAGARATTPNPGAVASSTFVGADGLIYEKAPAVVPGLNGESFYGLDYDLGCADRGWLKAGLKRMGKLARVIERSGRRVVFTVAPNKTAVDGHNLDYATMPHGVCTALGLPQLNKVLDSFRDPNFLPLRRELAKDPRQAYWLTDAHWTTVGSSVYAKELAKKLSPRVGRAQKYTATKRTMVGDLYGTLGLNTPETADALLPSNGVKVRTAPGSQDFHPDAYYPVSYTTSWTSTPKRKTWPGKTLLVGDSFTLRGLESLRPVFHRGTFLWTQPWMIQKIAKAIPGHDTIVFESAQMFVAFSILARPDMLRAVKRELRGHRIAPRNP
jgi:hypothetical protein